MSRPSHRTVNSSKHSRGTLLETRIILKHGLTTRILAAGMSGLLLLPNFALAQTTTPPQTTTPIQHVVVIFQKNVSFDHYFASYPNAANNTSTEPSFTTAPNTPSVNGLTGPLLTANQNAAQPFRLTRAQAVNCDQDHHYADEQKAFNNGLTNKFVESVGVGTASCDVGGYGAKIMMGYYDGNTVTGLWNYRQNYAMNDNSFGTTFAPSTPGALNLVAGQTHGATVTAGSAAGNVGAGGSVIGDPRLDPSRDDCTLPGPRTYITNDRQERRRSPQREEHHPGLVPGRLQTHLYQHGRPRRSSRGRFR